MSEKNSYKDAGVDIEAGELAVKKMKNYVHETYNFNCLTELGSFGGLFRLSTENMKEPVLVSSIDGVGTKVKIASMMNKYDTVGQDIVNHCINDILVQGATPLFFMDYYATSKLDPEIASEIVKGMSIAAKIAGCAILGGETAEMPGVYKDGEFDIAGAIVGIVDKKNIIDGSKIKSGQVLIGLGSSGPHTNGYSLIRKLLFEDKHYSVNDKPENLLGESVGEALLKPHKSYLNSVLSIMKNFNIKGMAHITGGGFYSNIKRILPSNVGVKIISSAWDTLPIFDFIQKTGKISNEEMHRAFNMGIGMVLFVNSDDAVDILELAKNMKENAYIIGKVADSENSYVEVDFDE